MKTDPEEQKGKKGQSLHPSAIESSAGFKESVQWIAILYLIVSPDAHCVNEELSLVQAASPIVFIGLYQE